MTTLEKPLSEVIEEGAVKKAFKDTLDSFSVGAYKDDMPLMCEIHGAFGGLEGIHHNCLGCNFADSTEQIKKVLELHESYSEIRHSFPLYILSLYLLVERMDSVMDMVSVPDKFREKHFKVFQQIRKWANFIKHPKSFILVHHPDYNFENSGFEIDKIFQETINEQFVTEFYKGQKSLDEQKKINKELYQRLHNKKDILVLFPDIGKVTKKFCYSINKFVDLVTKNEVYIEILQDEATIENYFERQE
jgi:hypothetical protein